MEIAALPSCEKSLFADAKVAIFFTKYRKISDSAGQVMGFPIMLYSSMWRFLRKETRFGEAVYFSRTGKQGSDGDGDSIMFKIPISQPCRLIDVLPKRIPAGSAGHGAGDTRPNRGTS